jgi:hypothetical protein
MENFSHYRYKVLPTRNAKGFYYKIYNCNGTIMLKESQEIFAHEGIARYAAIGQIALMEKAS